MTTRWFRQFLLRAFAYGQTHRDDYVGVERLLTAIIGGHQSLAPCELRASGVRDQVPSEVVVLMKPEPIDG